MTQGLAVSRLINASVDLTPAGAQQPSVTSCMIFGDSDVINVKDRFRSYNSIAAVANDFGTNVPEYAAASLFFGQNPQPEQLYIARWAQAATHGLLICGALTPTQQIIGTWNAIVAGEFKIAVDGGGPSNVICGSFAAAANLNAVAAIIQVAVQALGGSFAAVTVTWNGSQFVFRSGTAGAASAVAPLTAGNAADISVMLAGTAALLAEDVPGIIAESALAAVEILDNMPVSFYMFGFASTHIVDADHLAIAAYVEADAAPHVYGYTTNEADALVISATDDIGYELQQLAYNRTGGQYSSTGPYSFFSAFGRMATVDFNGQNTTITLMYKQEPGVTPENLNATQANSLDAKNYNYYANYNNGVAILVNGICASGLYLDEIQGADWLVGRAETDMFNLLFQSPTKIPQTDAGVHQLVTTLISSLDAGVANGLIGPGVWEFNGFGQLNKGDFLEKGYYVFAPPVASQSAGQRASRTAPTIQAAVIFAGAVHKVSIVINVQR